MTKNDRKIYLMEGSCKKYHSGKKDRREVPSGLSALIGFCFRYSEGAIRPY